MGMWTVHGIEKSSLPVRSTGYVQRLALVHIVL